MASKLSVFVALFVCFLALANASFRITTTVLDDEENPLQRGQCQRQIQMERIHGCHRYISSQLRDISGRWNSDDLEMNPQRGQQSIQQCCQDLQQIDRECRCDALQEVARIAQHDQQQQQQGGQYSGSSHSMLQQRIQQQVRRLPQMCSVQVPQQCQQGY